MKLEKKNKELEIKILNNEKEYQTKVKKTDDSNLETFKEYKVESE